ncbi:MAG: BMP family ABC transporter substrate-binding protein, partial [Deltaproteobacteria bacterium]|nr:BMP family ABC transporter substrate-binding protein [Deltaproteobacteria bacterium]
MFIAIVCLSLSLTTPLSATAADKKLIFGMLMVGPYNDHGWSQAHFEAGKYVEEK